MCVRVSVLRSAERTRGLLQTRRTRFLRASTTSMSASPAGTAKRYRLDASAEGCTGLFFRKKTATGFATDGDGNWPRNGFVFQGKEVEPGWVQLLVRSQSWKRAVERCTTTAVGAAVCGCSCTLTFSGWLHGAAPARSVF